MRSRSERIFWGGLAAVAVAGAAAAWWTQERWLPHARPWLEQVWRSSTRPGPDSLPPGRKPTAAAAQAAASEPARPPRKCVQGGRTTYTDQPCPPGSQELAVEGGAVMRVPPPGASGRP